MLKDNQLWEKQDTDKEMSQHPTHKTEVTADGKVEKDLGPADAIMQVGNPYGFQPLMKRILGKDEDKANWQDWDPNIRIIKSWLKEGQQPTGTEMNFKTPEVQAYRKVLSSLKLKQVEGTTKTILVKQGLMGSAMDRYCLSKE